MKNVVLSNKIFRPNRNNDLVRLGRNFDGGYVVDRKSILNSDCLISMGIDTDWSFEIDFLKIADVTAFAFDGSISPSIFFKKLQQNLRLMKFSSAVRYFNLIFQYKIFFNSSGVQHVKKYVGFDYGEKLISFKTLKKMYIREKYQNIFFKIDIEGSEYRILDDLLEIQERTVGLVIEFHDFDIHQEKILKFIKSYALQICHIHINNYSPINNHLPLTVELTFTKFLNSDKSKSNYPTLLDQPNDPNQTDIMINFIDNN